MWKKIIIAIILFYFFALLQNSFLAHFNLFGAVPNLVFILFFLLVFFAKRGEIYQVIFFAIIDGIFLDIFSYSYIGPSLALLLIIAFLIKKSQSLLQNREDKYPFVYFLPLFLVCFLIYNIVLINFSVEIIFSIIYNVLAAAIFFYIYRRFFYREADGRQMRLFTK